MFNVTYRPLAVTRIFAVNKPIVIFRRSILGVKYFWYFIWAIVINFFTNTTDLTYPSFSQIFTTAKLTWGHYKQTTLSIRINQIMLQPTVNIIYLTIIFCELDPFDLIFQHDPSTAGSPSYEAKSAYGTLSPFMKKMKTAAYIRVTLIFETFYFNYLYMVPICIYLPNFSWIRIKLNNTGMINR